MEPKELYGMIEDSIMSVKLYSIEATELLFLTACVESDCGKYNRQLGGGPALGIFQMEPATHDDIWENYLRYRDSLASRVMSVLDEDVEPSAKLLVDNDNYACIMARIKYLRSPYVLPMFDDIQGLAQYWKDIYNTELGAGNPEHAIRQYNRYRSFV